MKIVLGPDHGSFFSDLYQGSTFTKSPDSRDEDDIFIKINQCRDEHCDRFYNCIRLSNGESCWIEAADYVYNIYCHCVNPKQNRTS
jgi:hypothetical protein